MSFLEKRRKMDFRKVILAGLFIVLVTGSLSSWCFDDMKVRSVPLEKQSDRANRYYVHPNRAAYKASFRQYRVVIPVNIEDLLVADFNKDAVPDIAYISYDSSTKKTALYVMKGDKNLLFKTKYKYSVNKGWTQFVGAADFEGNGKLDIAVVGDGNNAYFLIYPGKGNGQFESPKTYTPKDPWFYDYFEITDIFDLDGDDKPDVVELYWYNKVIAFQNLGGFEFKKFDVDIGFGVNCDGIAAGDFTGDGKDDLFTVDADNSTLKFFESKGDGTFTKLYAKGIGKTGACLFPALLNKDAKLDLIGSYEPWTMLGTGKGQLGTKVKLPGKGSFGYGIATGDFNGDQKLDIMGPESSFSDQSFGIWYYQGRGNGQFVNPVKLAPHLKFNKQSGGRRNIRTADFNKDGKLDVLGAAYFGAFTNPDSQSFVFFLNGKSPASLKISNLTMERLEFDNSNIIVKGKFDYSGSGLYFYYDSKSKEATDNAFLKFNITVNSPYYQATCYASGSFLDKRSSQSGTIEFNIKLPTTLTPSYLTKVTLSDFSLYDYNLVLSNELE
jgi:hypothetical protein